MDHHESEAHDETVGSIELRLTDITRYNDVEMGRLTLSDGKRQKSWKAIWLANLRYRTHGSNEMPRGRLPLSIKPNEKYLDCLRLKLTQRTIMWMLPLESKEWYDIGVDLYLCDEAEALTPLSRAGYQQVVGAVKRYNISELSVEEPKWIVDKDRLCHDEGASFDADFWDA